MGATITAAAPRASEARTSWTAILVVDVITVVTTGSLPATRSNTASHTRTVSSAVSSGPSPVSAVGITPSAPSRST